MKQQQRNIWPLVLILLCASLCVLAIDPQTNPHRDAGAVRRANNLSDVLNAATARGNLDVPSNASAVASLTAHEIDNSTHGASALASEAKVTEDISAHNVLTAVHGSTSVASEARVAGHELDQSTHGCTVVASATALSDHTGDASDPHSANLLQTNATITGILQAHNIVASMPYIEAYAAVAQEVPTSSDKVASFGDVITNWNGAWNGTDFTVPVKGIYQVITSTRWEQTANAGYRQIRLQKNGAETTPLSESLHSLAANGLLAHTLTVSLKCEPSNTLRIIFAQDSGDALDALASYTSVTIRCVERLP